MKETPTERYQNAKLDDLLVDLKLGDEIYVIPRGLYGAGNYLGSVSYVPWFLSKMTITEIKTTTSGSFVVYVK